MVLGKPNKRVIPPPKGSRLRATTLFLPSKPAHSIPLSPNPFNIQHLDLPPGSEAHRGLFFPISSLESLLLSFFLKDLKDRAHITSRIRNSIGAKCGFL